MTDIIVHTVEARGNVLLEFVQGYLQLGDDAVRKLIVDAVKATTRDLRSRGIEYSALGAALTPKTDRRELALIFEIARVGRPSYGRSIHDAILPLLGNDESHSVLSGDLLGDPSYVASLLSIHLRPSGQVIAPPSGTAFYCVYINNLSVKGAERLHRGLSEYPPYLGYADTTTGSAFKTYVSTTVGAAYVQHRSNVVQAHPDDSPPSANENTLGYDFETAGFHNKSIPSVHFGLLLSYKIERPVVPGYERDQKLTLNAVTSQSMDIADCTIEIDDRKLQYLRDQKAGSLKRLGLLNSSSTELEHIIRSKLRSSYLYSLRFRADCSVASFNLLLELEFGESDEPTRAVAAFAYEPAHAAIRLITLF